MKRTLALILTVLMLVSMIPATLLSVIARGPGVLPNGIDNQSIDNAPYQYIPETVLIDGVLDDTAWPNKDWNMVTSDSGTWSVQYPTAENATKFYKYQLKVDYYYLYGAVVMNSAPTGAVTIWLNDESVKNAYSDKIVIDFANETVKRYDNNGAEIVSYATQNDKKPYYYEEFEFSFGEENGKKIVEFRSHRADFHEENVEFSYFVSAEFDNGESLYHPAIALQDISATDRNACFPSTSYWPEGAKEVTAADINGYGELSLAMNTYINIDGSLDESIWAAQTEFYHKWYERINLPSWTDNQAGGSVAAQGYKDFADVSANVLPYENGSSAKFDLYVTEKYICGAALVYDTSNAAGPTDNDYYSATEHTGIRFYMYKQNGEHKDVVQVDLRYDAGSTNNDYGKIQIGNSGTSLTVMNPEDVQSLVYNSETGKYEWQNAGLSDGSEDGYFDNQFRDSYYYDNSYGKYYDSSYVTSEHTWYENTYTYGYSTLGFTYSQLPAGPGLYVFEFMIDRNAWGEDFQDFVPEAYTFATWSELDWYFNEGEDYDAYKNAYGSYVSPRYYKNPNNEFYDPYTAFTPDGTLGERYWPNMVASANNVVNTDTVGSSTRVDSLNYYPLIRGDLNYMYGSVVIELGEKFGNWKPSTSLTQPDGDIFELWLAEADGYNGGTGTTFDGNVHRYGIWMDQDGTAYIGAYYDGEYHGGGKPWKVAIKKYEDSVIKKPKYEYTFEEGDDGTNVNDYDVAYTEEIHDYYVIEFAIPVDQLGDGMTFDINDENFNSETAASAIENPIAYFHTSMHVAPADTETDNTTGFTMFFPRTDDDITDYTLDTITSTALEYSYPHYFNEHDIYFALNIDGKIIEEQRIPLNHHVIDFSNSEYRIASVDGNYLSYKSMLLTGAKYTMFGAVIDGEFVKGAYTSADKTMVTIWAKDTGNGSGTTRLDFFNDGEYNYFYVNGAAYSGYSAYNFSSANGETYFEGAFLTTIIDPDLDGFKYFVEINQVINGETLNRVHPKITLPEIREYEIHFVPTGNTWANNAGTIDRIEHFLPEAIEINGDLTDNGWTNKWFFVSRDINACGQETNVIDSLAQTDFYYQMRMDEDYLYVAAVVLYKMDDGTALTYQQILSQTPGFRLWIKEGENDPTGSFQMGSNTYTKYYDIKPNVKTITDEYGNITSYYIDGDQPCNYQSYDNTFPSYPSNTRDLTNKYYQFVSNKYIVGESFKTYYDAGYGESTLWGETIVTLLDSEGKVVKESGETRGEMVDTGAIIKKIGELKKNGGDVAVEEYTDQLANDEENPTNVNVSTGVEAGVMIHGEGHTPNGFESALPANTMIVEMKVDLDEFGGRDIFQYYVSTATHSWTSKTTMYPAIVSDPGSKSNYFHVNYPYWKWTDEHSFIVDEDVRAELMMRTYKRPVTTLGAKVSESYTYMGNETNAIRFGGLWNEEYIRKVNGLRETNGYTESGKTDNLAYEGDDSVGNYTDYWDVKAMGMVFLPTHLVKENERADRNDKYSAHPGKYELFVDTPGAAWMDADGIVSWVGPKGSDNNFCDYENFAFYVTLVNVPDNAKHMNFCFRGFVEYYDDVSGATPYYDAILERSINMVTDAASSSTDNDKTWEDEALEKGPFVDDYYKPGTSASGDDKENDPSTNPDTPDPEDPEDPEKIAINSIELTTNATIVEGETLFTPIVNSINGGALSVNDVQNGNMVVNWYDASGNRLDIENVSFVAGGKYDLYVRFTCNDAYEISDSCVMTLTVGEQTFTGVTYANNSNETNLAVDFEIVVPGGEVIPPVPQTTYAIEYVNNPYAKDSYYGSVLLASPETTYVASNYTSTYTYWSKVLLEYDEEVKAYKVVTVSPRSDATSMASWSYGGNKVIFMSYTDNAEALAYIESLTEGQYVQITGTDLATLQGMYSTAKETTIGIGTVDVQGGGTDPDDPEDPVDPDPEGTISFDTVNSSSADGSGLEGATVIFAANEYKTTSILQWWSKALLEYDDNEGYYKVIAVETYNSAEYTSWTYGIDRIIIASHADNTDGDLALIGGLSVGDLVIINGATLDELKSASDLAATGITAEEITVTTVVLPKPEVETPDIAELLPNSSEKVAYVPLDNRPVHTDRVEYLAEASGINLVMPDYEDYQTVLSTDSSTARGGNTADVLTWLKQLEGKENGYTDTCDYYVIALDQVFSGGLVTSREASTCTDENGGLSEQDMETIDFLVELSKENYVIYTETIIRLAMTTSGYVGYVTGDTRYYALRNYGIETREVLGASGNHALTLDNVISSYRYGSNGVTRIEYTTYGSYTIDEAELNGLLAARERKLRITDALIKRAGGNINRLILGLDDANATNHNLQSNERAYVEKLATEYGANLYSIAGCDEMGLMGIAALANDVYLGNDGITVELVTSGDTTGAADEYDSGSLDKSLEAHMNALGITSSGTPDIKIFVLGRDGDASSLVSQIKTCLDNNTPVAIIDAWKSAGEHNNNFLNALIDGGVYDRDDAGEILSFSHWNTVGNLVGISMSNAVSRYAYLKAADTITSESNYAFLQSIFFGYIKDGAYKPNQSTSWDYTAYAWPLMENLKGSFQNILGKNNGNIATGFNESSIDNVDWPWGRPFECTFDIDFWYNANQ